jgi:2-C-methyl-D-erythritol 4-phosphate cytidylyltransferase
VIAIDDEEQAPSSPDEVAVLIPAAGQGTRLGGKRKQLRRLGDAPVVVQTLRAFERCRAVGHLVVAGPAEGAGALRDLLAEAGLEKLHAVVEGGASRKASVQRAFERVPSEVNVVLVHDAVRPFIAAARIRAVAAAAAEHGAAALAVPASDTLRRGADGCFAETLDRRACFQMQTPQAFRRSVLADAFAQADASGAPSTDDVALAQAAGHVVRIARGDRRNFKITTPADWQLAEALWPSWVRSSEFGVLQGSGDLSNREL